MTLTRLVVVGLARRPIRTLLTGLSIAVAFLLFGLLHGVTSGLVRAVDNQPEDVLAVSPRYHGSLPIAFLGTIRAIPGVLAAAPVARVTGEYQDSHDPVSLLMTDPASYNVIERTVRIAPKALHKLESDRQSVVVTVAAARRFNWKVGDTIHLTTSVLNRAGGNSWAFHVVGVVNTPLEPGILGAVGRFSYYDESRALNQDTVDQIFVRVQSTRKASAVAARIDAFFANSSHPTRTLSERERLRSFFANLGDLGFFATSVIAASFFALLFLISNVAMQSVRERIKEFAVMEAMGFTVAAIVGVVVGESLVLNVSSAVAGIGLADLLFPKLVPMPLGGLSGTVILQGLLIACVVALATAAIPASRLARLSVTAALRSR
jgi:putative ABC transport system permease protein